MGLAVRYRQAQERHARAAAYKEMLTPKRVRSRKLTFRSQLTTLFVHHIMSGAEDLPLAVAIQYGD